MALIVEPRKERRTGFGGGLQTGIEMLLQNRMQNTLQRQQQQQTSSGLQALGFSPEESQQLSVLPFLTLCLCARKSDRYRMSC